MKHTILIKATGSFRVQLRRDMMGNTGRQGFGQVKARVDPEARALLDLYGKMPEEQTYSEVRLSTMEDCLANLGFEAGFVRTTAQRLQGMMDTSRTLLHFKQAFSQIRYDTPMDPKVRQEMQRRLEVYFRNNRRGNGDRYRIMDMATAASKIRGD